MMLFSGPRSFFPFNIFTVLALVLACTSSLTAQQQPEVYWVSALHSASHHLRSSVVETDDLGRILVAGEVQGEVISDTVARLTYGSDSLQQTLPEGHGVFLLNTDSLRNLRWMRVLNTGSESDGLISAEIAPDGNVYVLLRHAGLTVDGTTLQPGSHLLRFDPLGQLEWTFQVSPIFPLEGTKNLAVATDEVIVVATMGPSAVGSSMFLGADTFQLDQPTSILLQLDGSGDVVWQRVHPNPHPIWFWNVIRYPDGDLTIGMTFESDTVQIDQFINGAVNDSSRLMYLHFRGTNGVMGGAFSPFNQNERCVDLALTPAGGMFSLGVFQDFTAWHNGDTLWSAGAQDLLLMCQDPLPISTTKWRSRFGDSFSQHMGRVVMTDEEYIGLVVDFQSVSSPLNVLDSLGRYRTAYFPQPIGMGEVWARDLAIDPEDRFVGTGEFIGTTDWQVDTLIQDSTIYRQVYLVKFKQLQQDSSIIIPPIIPRPTDPVVSWNVYPVPSRSTVTVEIDLPDDREYRLLLWDAAGRLVYRSVPIQGEGLQLHRLPGESFASGPYTLCLNHGEECLLTRKVVISK